MEFICINLRKQHYKSPTNSIENNNIIIAEIKYLKEIFNDIFKFLL